MTVLLRRHLPTKHAVNCSLVMVIVNVKTSKNGMELHNCESTSSRAAEMRREVRVGGSLEIDDLVERVVVVDYWNVISNLRLIDAARLQVLSVR